nr:AraC family transcriptional regulator [Roseomonas rosulenta]
MSAPGRLTCRDRSGNVARYSRNSIRAWRAIPRFFTAYNSVLPGGRCMFRLEAMRKPERPMPTTGEEKARFDLGLARTAETLSQAATAVAEDLTTARILTARAQAMLAEIELELADRGGRPQRVELASWQARRVAAHIDSHMAGPITVAQLAGIARLSPAHFSRAFRGSFGMSPGSFIQHRRVEAAKRMLRETSTPLAEIAYVCGLCDQAHLSRVFKRAEGTSPMRWRRAHSAGLGETACPGGAARRAGYGGVTARIPIA